MPDENIAISVRDLVVGFGKHTVIDHLSLDVHAGEIIGLVGASGGGKSVLMRTLIGLLPKQGGEITFAKESGNGGGRRGVLFQQRTALPAETARRGGLLHFRSPSQT